MKKKSIVKVILDIIMIVLFIALMSVHDTGIVFHEIMGIFIFFLFALHLVLNGKWVIHVSKSLFYNKIKSKTFWMLILNLGLLMGIIIITVTGIMISKVLFPYDDHEQSITMIHKWSSYVTAVMMAAHLVLHIKYLIAMFMKIFDNRKSSTVKKVFGSGLAISIIVIIIYFNISSLINNSIDSKQIDTQIDKTNIDKTKEAITSTPPSDAISLSDFLGKMFCTICPRHCPLSNPQCGKSRNLIIEAEEEYQSLYGNIE